MSIFNFFTSKAKIVDDVFDRESGLLVKVGGFLNNLHYSDAEKQIDAREHGKNVMEFAKSQLDGETPRSKTRRDLAVKWFNMQIDLVMLTVLCAFIDKFGELIGHPVGILDDVSAIAFSGLLWSITSGIGLFLWGTHAIRASKLSK